MRIGELAQRTRTPTRMLRYYEEQGLLVPRRKSNGYRDFSEAEVDRVQQVRGLLEAGISTRVIKQILPCLGSTDDLVLPHDCTELLDELQQQRDQMSARIDCLTQNRNAVDGYLQSVHDASRPVSA